MVREQTDKTINIDRIKYYNITLKNTNGKTISLSENIAVMFPIPSDFDKSESDLSVYWVNPGIDDKFDNDT